MAGPRPNVEFIQLDERNALIYSEENTEYIISKVRQATMDPARRTDIYAEMARRFHIDTEKMNMAVIKYVDRMKRDRKREQGTDGRQKAIGSRQQGTDGRQQGVGGRLQGAGNGQQGGGTGNAQKKGAALDERVQMAALCREVGHRFVSIALSHKHGCRECERCGKHESQYNI